MRGLKHLHVIKYFLIKAKFTTALVIILARACEKVTSDLGLGGGFPRILRFPQLLTTG